MKFKIKGKEFKYFIGENTVRVTWNNRSVLIFKGNIDKDFDFILNKKGVIKKFIKREYFSKNT